MFTGIIEELGQIVSLDHHEKGAKIKISAQDIMLDVKEGDSIAVNGVCLTALEITRNSFVADVSQETLDRSTMSNLKKGSKVNLERAVKPTTRLGGHIVQGHVDSKGKFLQAIQEGDFWTVRISYPKELGQYLIYKGSVSVEGISLTISKLTNEYFEIAIIPKTWELTNLSTLEIGDAVNLEADVIAKYVKRMLFYKKGESETGVTMEKLRDLGIA